MWKPTLILSALYLALLGIGLMFFPLRFGIGAVPQNPSHELVALLRLLGAPFLGIAVLNWLSRETEPSRLRPVLIANVVGFGLVAANDIVGIATGQSRELARVFVVFHVLFTAAFIIALRNSDRPGRDYP